MLKRVLHRSHTSGRADDNEADFVRRYQRFMDKAQAVMDFYRGAGILTEVRRYPFSHYYPDLFSH
jgi:adenylate kinase family enzyme